MVLTSLVNNSLMSVLRQEPRMAAHIYPTSPSKQRQLLGDVLISSSVSWKEDTLKLLDQIWKEESRERRPTKLSELPVSAKVNNYTDIVVWRGDITHLSCVDAIVNAANEEGLGCFVPNHKCIDNVIHRQAGPRLRDACRTEMNSRGSKLTAGSVPIVTPGFHLPSKWVIHATGPQVHGGGILTREHEATLAETYENVLNVVAERNLKSVAFPCISTGLFGFPQDKAAKIALGTVYGWLKDHPNVIDTVVFDAFTEDDLALYEQGVQAVFNGSPVSVKESANPRLDAVGLAAEWIKDADAVLIVAGAGMSVKEGEMVYTNPEDFARHYPWFPKWGYRTSYEAMGLPADTTIPDNAKWALHAKHMDNMRWKFTPNQGYQWLRQLVANKEHFVLTSNVDGCFERSGFDPERVYTPQGEWTYLQCLKPCRSDSFFESRPYLDKILPHISSDGSIPKHLVPHCPNCGGEMFGNVRGGSWFIHHDRYNATSTSLQGWMESLETSEKKVVVLEVGAGFNTPTVTRCPAEAFARSLGERGRLVRINPSEPHVPSDLHAVALDEGWQVLGDILESKAPVDPEILEVRVRWHQKASNMILPDGYAQRFGLPGWRHMLNQLRRA